MAYEAAKKRGLGRELPTEHHRLLAGGQCLFVPSQLGQRGGPMTQGLKIAGFLCEGLVKDGKCIFRPAQLEAGGTDVGQRRDAAGQ